MSIRTNKKRARGGTQAGIDVLMVHILSETRVSANIQSKFQKKKVNLEMYV